jgi:hypothetical protein
MALTKADREWLELKMEESNRKAVDPIEKLVQMHHQSIYGPNNDNGLVGDMKSIKETVRKLDGFKNRVLGMASGASIGVTAVYHVVLSLLKSGGVK